MNKLGLKPIDDNDVKLIKDWLNKDYILKWFANAEAWLKELNGRHGAFNFIKHFLVVYNGRPIGFCQYYPCGVVEGEHYGDASIEGAYSMDYLIGEEDYLGKGLGKEIVHVLTETIFVLEDSRRVLLKPEKDNKPSCNALRANGYCYNEKDDYYYKEKF